ncbi:MAG: hypothetical protein II776_01535, partial [Clostridia bacterium]|nr:hypothetical protein [Clostridia bacterium]
MFRRLFAAILCAALMCSVTAARAADLAGASSVSDLSRGGVPALSVSFGSTPPVIDGTLAAGEYPAARTFSFGNGLLPVTLESREDLSGSIPGDELSGLRWDLGVSFDGAFFYLALRESGDDAERFGLSAAETVLIFSIGLSPDPSLFGYTSAWTANYHFSGTRCAQVSGRAVICDSAGVKSMTCRFGEGMGRADRCYTDESGVTWDSAKHASLAAASFYRAGEGYVFSAECAVPLGEVLLSVPEGERDQVRARLSDPAFAVTGSVYAERPLPASAFVGRAPLPSASLVTGCLSGATGMPAFLPCLLNGGDAPTVQTPGVPDPPPVSAQADPFT